MTREFDRGIEYMEENFKNDGAILLVSDLRRILKAARGIDTFEESKKKWTKFWLKKGYFE